ncbi:hypothetical protein DEVEQU_00013 [Devosia equisanguinis]|uniref:DUF4919 domain-containing protein n=1 Tax=Devosia equisanguinis TaxID=2490941 RepID=A0A447I5X2_9HYPH|nr:hypothetical protein [Devosia equisanguinis]VDS02894.1 hypothetical protein DEVEQU_00013 [Devosia equisanguinis]
MTMMRAAALTLLLAPGPATAAGSVPWDSFLAQMESYEFITGTADQFARLLGNEDQEGLDALAKEVAQSLNTDHLALIAEGFNVGPLPGEDEAQYFERLSTKVTQLGIFEDASASRVALEGLGACETAGILLRHLILMVADGAAKPKLIEGHLVLDGTGNDWRYAEAFARCQIVGRHVLQPSAVGYSQNACQATRQSYCPDIVDQ